MDRAELLKKLDTIIDVGIVNAHQDTEVLKAVREQLQETDLQAMKRILSGCKHMKGHWELHQEENDDDETVFDLTIRDFSDSVTLCFDVNGRLFA